MRELKTILLFFKSALLTTQRVVVVVILLAPVLEYSSVDQRRLESADFTPCRWISRYDFGQ